MFLATLISSYFMEPIMECSSYITNILYLSTIQISSDYVYHRPCWFHVNGYIFLCEYLLTFLLEAIGSLCFALVPVSLAMRRLSSSVYSCLGSFLDIFAPTLSFFCAFVSAFFLLWFVGVFLVSLLCFLCCVCWACQVWVFAAPVLLCFVAGVLSPSL